MDNVLNGFDPKLQKYLEKLDEHHKLVQLTATVERAGSAAGAADSAAPPIEEPA